MMKTFDDLLKLTSGALNYVCAKMSEVEDPEVARKLRELGGVDSCSRCRAEVAVTPSVLAENKAQAHNLHRELVIVCGSCAERMMDSAPMNLVRLPSERQDAEAERIINSAKSVE